MSLTTSGQGSGTPSVQGQVLQGNRSWAQIVGRSQHSTISNGIRRKAIILYEDEKFLEKDRAMKASAALQRALRPEGVFFDFGAAFPNKTAVYKALKSSFPTVLGAKPIPGRRALLEVSFGSEQEANKAIQEGLEMNGIVYKGTPTVSSETEFVQVHLHDLYLVDKEDLLQAITNAMDHFGKIAQIRMYIDQETEMFEGEATVVLDRTIPKNMPEDHYADLDSREVYFPDWDDMIQVTFKGCPPKCRYCGGPHRKAECPKLAAIVCYECKEKGHIRRRCPYQREQRAQKKKHTSQSNFEDLDDGDMLDAYERKKQKMKEKEKEKEDEEDNVMVDVQAKNVSEDLENNTVVEAMTMDAIEPQDSKENGDEI
ncbi:hypothetical protein EC973_000730, partial [Apophysomyces ossiformis]